MGLFNFMLFVMLRRKLYLLYTVAIFSLVLYQVIQTGAAWTVLWPHLGLRDDWPPYVAWVVYFALIVASRASSSNSSACRRSPTASCSARSPC